MGATVGVGETAVGSTGGDVGRGVASSVGVTTSGKPRVGCTVEVRTGVIVCDGVTVDGAVGGSVGLASGSSGRGTGWKQAAKLMTIHISAMPNAKLIGFTAGSPSDRTGCTPTWATDEGNY